MYLTVGDDPVYSPTGERVAYLKYSEGADPYSRDTVRLKDIKTQETKTILENVKFEFGLALSVLHWSNDGSLLLVEAVDKVYVFNKEGSAVFEGTVKEVINKFGAIFTNL